MDWEPLFAIIVFGAIAYATKWGWYREGMPPRTRGEEVTKPGWPREDRSPTATPQSPHELRALPYEEYLQTPHCKGSREDKLRAVGHLCQVCNSGLGTLDVHHRTYERLGQELDEDLTVLCRACHSIFHEQRHLGR